MENTMRFLNLAMLVLFSFVLIVNCGGDKEKAIKYNDAIVEEMNKLNKMLEDIGSKDGADLEKSIADFQKALPESKKRLEALGKFKGSESLDKAAIDICDFYQEVVDGKWADKADERVQRGTELSAALQQAQKDFAERFGIQIQGN
jgi:signal transduction protein with GAF and PtsI domain